MSIYTDNACDDESIDCFHNEYFFKTQTYREKELITLLDKISKNKHFLTQDDFETLERLGKKGMF